MIVGSVVEVVEVPAGGVDAPQTRLGHGSHLVQIGLPHLNNCIWLHLMEQSRGWSRGRRRGWSKKRSRGGKGEVSAVINQIPMLKAPYTDKCAHKITSLSTTLLPMFIPSWPSPLHPIPSTQFLHHTSVQSLHLQSIVEYLLPHHVTLAQATHRTQNASREEEQHNNL